MRIGIRFIEGLGQEGSRQGAFVDMRAFGQIGELGGVYRIKGHVDSPCRVCHPANRTRLSTKRAVVIVIVGLMVFKADLLGGSKD